jgi:hypothetical protein
MTANQKAVFWFCIFVKARHQSNQNGTAIASFRLHRRSVLSLRKRHSARRTECNTRPHVLPETDRAGHRRRTRRDSRFLESSRSGASLESPASGRRKLLSITLVKKACQVCRRLVTQRAMHPPSSNARASSAQRFPDPSLSVQ